MILLLNNNVLAVGTKEELLDRIPQWFKDRTKSVHQGDGYVIIEGEVGYDTIVFSDKSITIDGLCILKSEIRGVTYKDHFTTLHFKAMGSTPMRFAGLRICIDFHYSLHGCLPDTIAE